MDKLIYTAMSGASHTLQQQAAVSQNLANTNTPGFRAQINSFRAVPLVGEGLPTRTFVVDSNAGADFTEGVMEPTGRALDIAVNMIAADSGNIANIDQNGALQFGRCNGRTDGRTIGRKFRPFFRLTIVNRRITRGVDGLRELI